MPKFNGTITLGQFKKAAGKVAIYGTEDAEWRSALERARSWRAAAMALPYRHPMLAIAAQSET